MIVFIIKTFAWAELAIAIIAAIINVFVTEHPPNTDPLFFLYGIGLIGASAFIWAITMGFASIVENTEDIKQSLKSMKL